MRSILPVVAWVVCIALGVVVVLLFGDVKKSIESSNTDERR